MAIPATQVPERMVTAVVKMLYKDKHMVVLTDLTVSQVLRAIDKQ